MTKVVRLVCVSALLVVLGAATRAEAAAILFTDRDAFILAAQPGAPLGITAVDVLGPGTVRLIYGDLLPVTFDSAGIPPACGGPNPFILGCTSIGFGGGGFGAGFTSVGSFLQPVTAVGYEVLGAFTLFGTTVEATTPQFFGYIFDAPTTRLPLPEFAYALNPPGLLPAQRTFHIQNIVVSTPEPATLMLLGTAAAFGFAGRRRRQGR